ncbi:hypothetical protein N7507_011269 [Penicillium longicatenatum]|nr:hypothetical protein N7507_011269 [Penicillium longicatenatum]
MTFWSDDSTNQSGKGARHEDQFAARGIDLVSCHEPTSQMFWAAFSDFGRWTGLTPIYKDHDMPCGGTKR